MFDIKLRLISMLGLLTVIVLAGLVLDYMRVLRRPMRLGLSLAVLGIAAGIGLTLSAVLPGSELFGAVYSEGKTTQKVVALTFDDGPYPPYTNQILDILQENQIQATFFLIGRNAEKHPDLVRRISMEGHQIGNHTYNHVDLLKANYNTVVEEVDKTGRVIAAITGKTPQAVRPPHGFRDPAVLKVMAERGLKVVEWSVMSKDWTNPGTDVIVKRTLAKVQNGSVILLHDGDGIAQSASRAQTVEATRRIIRELRLQGYKFVTVNEILSNAEEQEL